MTRIHADFNDFDPDGRLSVLIHDADGPVAVGGSVLLYDAEGNKVHATVEEIREDGIIFCRLDWGTWNRTIKYRIGGVPRKMAVAGWEPKNTGPDRDPEDTSTLTLA